MKDSIRILGLVLTLAAYVVVSSCSTQQKYKRILAGEVDSVKLNLSKEESFIPEIKNNQKSRDTLKIHDDTGNEILILKAVKDEETGEMVATDVIEAATVTARFRNIAERRGKVDLCFQVTVPAGMQDSKWQLRLYPDMFILGDSTRLEPVIITGNSYREDQLRGYKRYNLFVSKIEEDSTKFINQKAVDRFMKQFGAEENVDEKLMEMYGVTKEDVVNYYTNQYAREINDVRKSLKGKKYRKHVRVPIVTEGIRLDTVMVNEAGDFVYDYVQTINTRPKLRKAEIKISGDIYDDDKRIYVIPTTDNLTFYISSVVSFVDNTERYLTKVIERKASANTAVSIDFEVAKSDVKLTLGDNANSIRFVKKNLASLIENTEFDLDSIVVGAAASPDGSYALNSKLAHKRSESVTKYFEKYIKHYTDSLKAEAEQGFSISIDNELDQMSEEIIVPEKLEIPEIKLTPRSISENWDDLMVLVREDTVMTDDQKNKYFEIVDKEKNLDRREHLLRSQKFFSHMKNNMYPKLRTVKFNFYLHRKGMVKDTLHTTILDTVYAKGVQALKDMDYNTAIEHLISYDDYNTAVAYMGLDRNQNALRILEKMERTDQVNYLLAILYSRFGEEEKAVEAYMKSVQQNPSYVYRGNLDPEISVLIKRYGLNQEEEDDFLY